MKQKWLVGALGAIALVFVTAWTRFGVAHAVSFTPPSNNSAPRQATGGASRGGFFTPPPGRTAPQQAIGGASRGGFFTPPPGRTAPQQAHGGASRTNAYGAVVSSTGVQPLLALTPEGLYGTTLQAHPTVLVYVPASSAQEGVFSLKDEAKNLVYQMVVPVSSAGGTMAIELPESAPALKVGQNYQWFFALKLDGSLNPASPFVDAWIQRIEPSREQSQVLAPNDPIARIAALGSQGVWYDTAAELMALQVSQPDESIAQHWEELLESVGLADISAASITVE